MSTDPTPAASAGRFRVLRLLAQGGLGEVHVADDPEVGREVALKRIRADLRREGGHERSFLREARVTGRLEHPGVVPVYGMGTDADGTPYYAMRLIGGSDMQTAIDALHAGPMDYRGGPFRRLLGRLATVCQTLEYAHSRGIIHRDIKPANVMLGDYGETLVVDWGLARSFREPVPDDGEVTAGGELGRDAELSRTRQIKGTPAYLAPEQAAGRMADLGPACDVYALGGVLYALLTGASPAAGRGVMEHLEALSAGQPPVPPRRRVPSAPAALEAVCLRAMASDPLGRYARAADLAADIERYLADEPPDAYRAPLPERVARSARRHPRLVAGTLAALAVGLAVLGVKNRELDAANAREVEARRSAESAAELAGRAVDRFLVAVTEDADLKRDDFRRLRRRLLEAAQPFYRELAGLAPQSERQATAQANAHFRLGLIADETGDAAGAKAAWGEAARLSERLMVDHPGEPLHPWNAAQSRNNLGAALRAEGRLADARAEYDAALKLAERLTADDPENADYAGQAASARVNRAAFHADAGAWADSAAELRVALQTLDALPATPVLSRRRATARGNLALAIWYQGDTKAAADLFRRAAAERAGLADATPDDAVELAKTRLNLAGALAELGDPAAEAESRAALAALRPVCAAHPSVPAYRSALAGVCSNLAGWLRGEGRDAEAEGLFREALALRERLVTEAPAVVAYRADLGATWHNLGGLLRSRRPADAPDALRRAVEIRAALAAESPTPGRLTDLAATRNNLALAHGDAGDTEGAIRETRAAASDLDRLPPGTATPERRWTRAALSNNLGVQLAKLGRAGEAADAHREAVALRAALAAEFPAVPTYRIGLAESHLNLGLALDGGGAREAALAEFDAADRLFRRAPDSAAVRANRSATLWSRGDTLAALGRHADATAAYAEAVPVTAAADLPALRLALAGAAVRANQPADARAAVGTLRGLPLGVAERFALAGVFGGLCGIDAANADAHAADALAQLEKIRLAGAFDNAKSVALLDAADLAPLRSRPEYARFRGALGPPEVLPRPRR